MSGALLGAMAAGAGGLDQQTIVSASTGSVGFRIRGYVNGSQGSLTPNTSAIYGGALITNLSHDEASNVITLTVTGTSLSRAAWTSLTITGGTPLLQASASYSSSGGLTTWSWSSGLNGLATGTKTVTWN